MTQNIPYYIPIVFSLVTFTTMLFIVWAVKCSIHKNTREKTNVIFVSLSIWLIIQLCLMLTNVYNDDLEAMPPKIMPFGIFPPLLLVIGLFFTTKGKTFIDSLPLKNLTYLHVVRIPVELVLYWLFLYKAIPEQMTFTGQNFDILAGMSAPFVAYFGFTKNKIGRRTILIWNIVCLGLLVNIVGSALLSTPSPFQQFAFDQPNIAIINFPYSWLATFIVPIVLFCHLASIRQLTKNQ